MHDTLFFSLQLYGKRVRDNVFVVWTHDVAIFTDFVNYLNCLDSTGKIKFTMPIADNNGLDIIITVTVYFRSRNFREQKLSRDEKFARFLHFASINFRESAKIEFFAS